MIDYYELMEIDESAGEVEIEREYFNKVRKYTPEKALEMFAKIREAYDALKNGDFRKGYKNTGDMPSDERIISAGELLDSRNFKEAIKAMKEVLESYPEAEPVKNMLAGAYEKNSEFGNASKVYEGLSGDYPENQEYAIAFVRCLYWRSHTKKAYKQFEKAVGINVKNSDAWSEWVYTVADESGAAEKVIEMAEAFYKDMFERNYYVYAFVWINSVRSVYSFNRECAFDNYDLLRRHICFYEKDNFPDKARVSMLFECLREVVEVENTDTGIMEKGLELVEKSVLSETPFKREHPKIGRNDPCPCGSGKSIRNAAGHKVIKYLYYQIL